MPDEEPARTLAVLLGASTFPNAPKLAEGRAFYISAADVKEYLCDSAGLALPRRNVLSLFDDSRSPSDQLVEVAGFLTRRSLELKAEGIRVGDLFIYYVGHGLFTRGDQAYCLAIRSTNEINEGATSIRASDLAGVIKENAAFLRRYLIFDCCFAASIHKEFQSGPLTAARVQIAEQFPERGTALLCSSNSHEPSLAPRGLEHTMFSNALLQALRNGREGIGARLSFSELGDLIKENLRIAYPDSWVRPEVHSPDQREGDIASIPIFPNPAFHESDAVADEIAQHRKAEEDRIVEQRRLATEKAESLEKIRLEHLKAEEAERQRVALELAEGAKAEQERIAREKAETIRLAREKAEADDLAQAEEASRERLRALARAAGEERDEAYRTFSESAEAERKAAEAVRIQKQQVEQERLRSQEFETPLDTAKPDESGDIDEKPDLRNHPAVKILGAILIFAILLGGGLWLSRSPKKQPEVSDSATTATEPSRPAATTDAPTRIPSQPAATPTVKSGTTQKIAISSGSATGLLIDKVAPVYPSIARAARVQGTVILRATISKTGDIAYLEVISGDPLLRSGVMDAVRRWKYKPYLVNGEPVAVDTTINVVFHLDDSGAPAANGIGSANQVHLPAANSPGKLINAPPEYANSAANANPAATAFNLSSRYAIAGPDDAQTVLDTKTGLMWMRKDYRNIEGKFAFNWDDATAWPSKINTQSYGGYSDWRVPTITQYRTINNSKSDRMIYATIFAKTEAEDYWSSNTPGPYTASYISFQLKDGGYAVSGDRKMPVQYSDGSQMRMSVRLVRLVRIARKEAK